MDRKYLISLGLATAVLTACGGSSSSSPEPEPPEPQTVNLNGKVADGYLVGAKVCLDLNENKMCDEGEPSTTSTAGGSFNIEGITQEQIDTYPIVVEVTAGVVDEDTGEAISSPYTLAAPIGYNFVSPLTTMVQNEIEQGASQTDAETQLQTLLGTETDLSVDYVASQLNDALSQAEQDEFERLHQVAQVTAHVIANNLSLIESAAQQANISSEDVLGLIVDQVIEALEVIVNEVEFIEEQGLEFNVDDVVESEDVQNASTVSTDNLEEQVQIRDAEANAAAANLVDLVTGDGINFLEADFRNNKLELGYGTLIFDQSTNTTSESFYSWVDGEFVLQPSDGHDSDDIILTENGWVVSTDNLVLSDLNEDGSINLINPDFPVLAETISAKQTNVAGLNIGLFLGQNRDTALWKKVLNPELTFSEGGEAFELSINNLNDVYAIYNWDECEPDQVFEGMCNNVWVQTANGEDGPATTLASLISATASDGTAANLTGPHVAWNGSKSILAEIISGGSVNYHKIQWQADSTGQIVSTASLFATGTWRESTQSNITMLLLPLPDEVKRFGIHDAEDGELLLAEYNGAVRRGEFIAAGEDSETEVVFNASARNDIITNVDMSLLAGAEEPEPDFTGFVCRDGDSDWDEANDRPIAETLKSVAEYRALVTNCRSDSTQVFTEQMLIGYQLKSIDSDGTIETILIFNENGAGSFIDMMDGQSDEQAFTWEINQDGELLIVIQDSTGVLSMRVIINLIATKEEYLSVKGFLEDAQWAPMDFSQGEVWSDKLKKFQQ